MKKDLLYWIWFTTLNGIGRKTQKKLIEVFKHPKNLWNADADELRNLGVLNKANISTVLNEENRSFAYITIDTIDKLAIKAVSADDEQYPEALRNIYDYPYVIYIKGELKPEDMHFAIVGTRRATDYGRRITFNIAEELAGCGMTIVSGMAEGIDTYAHRGALKGNGRTIAVLGSGHEKIYPQSNEKLYHQIIENGAVVTEYLPYTEPAVHTFPARNRIISGLSSGVLVVESAEQGGALITARYALEQNRDLFAIPGNITCIKSRGPNNLLKKGEAGVVTCSDDIMQSYMDRGVKKLYNYKHRKNISETNAYKNCDEIEKSIIDLLFVKDMGMDELMDITGFSIPKMSQYLMTLEIKGLVRVIPGGIYCV